MRFVVICDGGLRLLVTVVPLADNRVCTCSADGRTPVTSPPRRLSMSKPVSLPHTIAHHQASVGLRGSLCKHYLLPYRGIPHGLGATDVALAACPGIERSRSMTGALRLSQRDVPAAPRLRVLSR